MNFSQAKAARVVAVALFAAVLGFNWDVWWHQSIGRDTFWEPPHALFHISILIALATSIYVWMSTRDRKWKLLVIALLLAPLSAPFDEIWHRVYGVEALNSPWMVFSPPHLVFLSSFFLSAVALQPILSKESDVYLQIVLRTMGFAIMLNCLLFLSLYTQPLMYWEDVHAFYAGFTPLFLVAVLLFAQHALSRSGVAVSVIVFFLVLATMTYGVNSPGITTTTFAQPMMWLTALAYLGTGLAIDLLVSFSVLVRGIAGGLLFGILQYGFTSSFLRPEFHYSTSTMFIEVSSCVVGGVLASVIVWIYENRLSHH